MDARPVRAGFWVVLLVGIFVWAPATYPGYWQSLEGFVPVFNAAPASPIARIATTPDLWRGAGSGAFLLAQPFLLAGLAPTAAVRAIFILSLLLGGLGIYSWLMPYLGDRAAGLGGLLYMLLPPVLATVYVRGSVSDALLLGLLPMALAGLAAYAAGQSPVAAGVAVLSILWMWRTQAGLAVFATLLLLLYVMAVERSRLGTLVVAVSGVAGLTSLLPLWHIAGAPPVDFFDHFVYVDQLLGGAWQVAPSVPGWQDGYPFFIGLTALAFSAVSLWLWLAGPQAGRPQATSRLLAFAFAGAGLLLLANLGASAWLWQITGAHRLLTYPWQVTLLAAPLLAVTAGSIAAHGRPPAAMPYWAVLVAVAVLGSAPYLTTRFTQAQPPLRPVAVVGSQGDLVLLDAQLTEDSAAAAAHLDVTWQVLRPLPFDYNVFFQALTEGDQGDLQTVAQVDVQPRDGLRPATTWQAGEILTDTYRLDLSAVMPTLGPDQPGLTYYFGYYDWRDGTRLPVDGGRDDKVTFYGR